MASLLLLKPTVRKCWMLASFLKMESEVCWLFYSIFVYLETCAEVVNYSLSIWNGRCPQIGENESPSEQSWASASSKLESRLFLRNGNTRTSSDQTEPLMKHQEDTSCNVIRDAVGLRHDERSSVGNLISLLPSSFKSIFSCRLPGRGESLSTNVRSTCCR